MGEYLDLRSTLNNAEISDYLHDHLPENLASRLDVADSRVMTKLATCTDVHTTFDEMVALHALARNGPFHYGPGHEYNATPDELLKTWACLYLGPWEERNARKPTAPISQEFSEGLDHGHVWRRTKKVQSEDGRWYHRKLRPDETSGGRGNPNGRRVPCPNDGQAFHAAKVGFAWDYEHNLGRDLYRCKPCGTLFNTGEYETPQYADLASMLSSPDDIPGQHDHLEGGALVYHVIDRDDRRVGIEHLVSGAPIRVEKADALHAARYLIEHAPDHLDPLTLQHEREDGTHVPLAMGELECFADLYNGAYQLARARES